MKKIEAKVVSNGPINWPRPTPTEKDWVLARVLLLAFEADERRASLNYDFVRSLRYLVKQVGFVQFGEMFDALRNERKEKLNEHTV